MDVEDQRWFTRYYLRRKLTEALEFEGGSERGGREGSEGGCEKDPDEAAAAKAASVGGWRTFVALDRFGDLFQTTHETVPAQYRLGAVSAASTDDDEDEDGDHGDQGRCHRHDEWCGSRCRGGQWARPARAAAAAAEGYASRPTGRFGGAGVVWNAATQRAPLLLHGNDWKERTFNALSLGLAAGGWPPAPFWLETSLAALPGDPPGDPGAAFGRGLWLRWTDPFSELLHSYQARHGSWLPHEDCGPLAHACMADRLRVAVGQRMVARELAQMAGNVFPLLPLLRGAPGLHSSFWTDLFLRGVVGHNPILATNATRLLRLAVASRPTFAPASHLLAEVRRVWEGGGGGGGKKSGVLRRGV
jgi:hypothetical protein